MEYIYSVQSNWYCFCLTLDVCFSRGIKDATVTILYLDGKSL